MQKQKPRASSPARLETQIHRRKKAKASSPLLPEWEKTDSEPPVHLRMTSDRMAPPSTPSNKT